MYSSKVKALLENPKFFQVHITTDNVKVLFSLLKLCLFFQTAKLIIYFCIISEESV